MDRIYIQRGALQGRSTITSESVLPLLWNDPFRRAKFSLTRERAPLPYIIHLVRARARTPTVDSLKNTQEIAALGVILLCGLRKLVSVCLSPHALPSNFYFFSRAKQIGRIRNEKGRIEIVSLNMTIVSARIKSNDNRHANWEQA